MRRSHLVGEGGLPGDMELQMRGGRDLARQRKKRMVHVMVNFICLFD